MTDTEKKLLQAQHRLEEAQARDRVKERKARTRRLIQEGAILEKVLPEVRTMELSALEGYLSRKLGKRNLNFRWEVSGKPGAFLFFSRRAHLLTTPKGRWYFLRKSCALRGGLRLSAAASRQCHSTCRVLLSSSAQIRQIPSLAKPTLLFRPACANLPPAALPQRWTGSSARPFSLLRKRNRKRKNEVNEDMAIYHLEAKVVSRGAGRSAVAASAYLSCSRLYNDYDGIQHDYTKKAGACLAGGVSAGICPAGMAGPGKALERRGGSRDGQGQQAWPVSSSWRCP